MPQGGYLEQKPRSPGSLAIVIALHASALTALMLAKTEYERTRPQPIVVTPIEAQDDPPPLPEPGPKAEAPRQQSVIRYVPPEVPSLPQDEVVIGEKSEVPLNFDPGPVAGSDSKAADPAPIPPPPLPDPVRVEARLDQRSDLQPPYPAAEERAGKEGSVTVRLLIGADGRVKAVDKVSATSDAFYRATERQALRRWRFKPATVDERPVESRTTMTVRFQLPD